MSDFSLKILNSELKLNLRNCRRSLLGFGMSTCRKLAYISGISYGLSDIYLFNSLKSENLKLNSNSDFLDFLKNKKLGERKFRLNGFLRFFSHFFLARLTLEVDLTRRLKFLANQCKFLRMYRGIRSFFFLPCRGQRTRTNAASRKLLANRRKVKTFRNSSQKLSIPLLSLLKYKVDPLYGRLANLSNVQSLALDFNLIKCVEAHILLNPTNIFELSTLSNFILQEVPLIFLRKKKKQIILNHIFQNKCLNALRRNRKFVPIVGGLHSNFLTPQTIGNDSELLLVPNLYFDFFFKYNFSSGSQ